MRNTQDERKQKEGGHIQSVERALNILELLCQTQDPMGVAEISEALNINRTTVYGLLNTLLNKDYLVKSSVGSKYVVSGKLYNLSYSYPNRLPVVHYASRYMIDLANKYNVTVHLGTFGVKNDILLVKAQFPKNIQNIRSGNLFPIYASGMGKVMLAFLPENKRKDIIEKLDLKSYTKNTIIDKERLQEEIEQIRGQGYSRDQGEYMDNTSCVAFPIFDSKNSITAALSLSSTPDVIEPQLKEMIPDGLQCSKSCSMDLGWNPFK